MTTKHIKIGVARKNLLERYPAHITKISGRKIFTIWDMKEGVAIMSGELEEIKEWAKENGYKIDATNRLGKSILN